MIQEHQNRGIIYSYTIPSQQGSTKSHIRHHRHKHTPKPAARPSRPSTHDTTSPSSSPSATPSSIVEADDDDDKRASQIQADQYQSDQVVIPNAYQELLQRQQLLGSSYPKSYQPGAASYSGQPGAASYPGQPGAASYPGQAGAASYPGQPRTFNSAYVGSVLQQSGKNIYRVLANPERILRGAEVPINHPSQTIQEIRNRTVDLRHNLESTTVYRALSFQALTTDTPIRTATDNRNILCCPLAGRVFHRINLRLGTLGNNRVTSLSEITLTKRTSTPVPTNLDPTRFRRRSSQQQYYPNPGNAALEQPSGNGYVGQDFYRPQAIQPVPRQNNQVPLQTLQDAGSLNGGGAGYNGGGAGYNGNGAGYNGGGTDYSWKLTGFSECSRTCGGGKWSDLYNNIIDMYYI